MSKMSNKEWRRLTGIANAIRQQHSFAQRTAQSKRTVKGRAKGYGQALKQSRVNSANMETLQWNPFSYKAVNNNFNVNRAS